MSVCCNSVAYINRGKGRSFMRVCWGFSSTKQYSMCTKCIKKNPELVKEALTFVGHADYHWEQGELVPVGWQHPRPVGWFVANSWSGQLPPHTMQVNSTKEGICATETQGVNAPFCKRSYLPWELAFLSEWLHVCKESSGTKFMICVCKLLVWLLKQRQICPKLSFERLGSLSSCHCCLWCWVVLI